MVDFTKPFIKDFKIERNKKEKGIYKASCICFGNPVAKEFRIKPGITKNSKKIEDEIMHGWMDELFCVTFEQYTHNMMTGDQKMFYKLKEILQLNEQIQKEKLQEKPEPDLT